MDILPPVFCMEIYPVSPYDIFCGSAVHSPSCRQETFSPQVLEKVALVFSPITVFLAPVGIFIIQGFCGDTFLCIFYQPISEKGLDLVGLVSVVLC